MSGVPYGAAMSGASGSFQGRGGNIFLTMQCGTMAQIKGETSACLPQVWGGRGNGTSCLASVCNMDPEEKQSVNQTCCSSRHVHVFHRKCDQVIAIVSC